DRWIVTILEARFTAPSHSNILIAASQTPNPTGAWNKFVFDNGSVRPDDPTVGTLGDQPSLGISANFLYTSADEFPFAGGGPTQESLRIFTLDDLYSGVANPPLEFGPLTDAAGFQYFAMRPAITHGPSNVEFVVSSDPRP